MGGLITRTEALHLSQAAGADIYLLAGIASKIREQYTGNRIDLCSIINGKSGNCSEDCKFCPQSVFHTCAIDTYPLLDEEKIIEYCSLCRAIRSTTVCHSDQWSRGYRT